MSEPLQEITYPLATTVNEDGTNIEISYNRYLVDAFTIFAASSLAANTVVRSVAGAVLPLAGLSMYDALGLGWGNSLLGFIALALAPLPFWISEQFPITIFTLTRGDAPVLWRLTLNVTVAKGEWMRTKWELKDL